MNSTIVKLFGENLINSLNDMLDDFISLSISEKELYSNIKDMNESVRSCLYLLAIERDDKKLIKKIENVNNQLKDERIDNFKKSFDKNEHKRFLALLNKIDKQSLLDDLNINVSSDEVHKLSKIDREYYDAIKESLMVDQEVDQRDGIDRFITYKKED